MRGHSGTIRDTRGFDAGEAAWFLLFDPERYQEDGSHELNGAPRRLEVLRREAVQRQQRRGLTWPRVGAFGLIVFTALAAATWVVL